MEQIQSCLSVESNELEKIALRRSVAGRHDWTLLAGKTAAIMASLLGADFEQKVREVSRDLADETSASAMPLESA